jgi:predicted Zn-dependent protease
MVFPEGWKIVNLRQVVGAVSPEEDAVVALSLAREKTAADAARAFFAPAGIQPGSRRRDPLVTFSATNSDGSVVDGIVGFVEHRDLVIRLLAYTGSSDFARFDAVMERSLTSFGELRDRRYLDVEPARIRIVELPNAMTLAEFNRRYPSSTDAANVALINGVSADAALEEGRLMKRVVGGEIPTR